MTVQGIGTGESVELGVPLGQRNAFLRVGDSDGDIARIYIDANHLRVLAKLAEAAADELDARSIGP